KPDVDYGRAQDGAHSRIRPRRERHRLSRGPGGDPLRAHHQLDRPPQVPPEGFPFAARAPGDGRPAPPSARLPQGEEPGALPGGRPAFGTAPLGEGPQGPALADPAPAVTGPATARPWHRTARHLSNTHHARIERRVHEPAGVSRAYAGPTQGAVRMAMA